jgi:hypothetical protein
MNASRETLEDQLQNYDAQLGGLRSFIKELKNKTDEHGTDPSLFEEDLFEAQHNVAYYEDAIARIKETLGGQDKAASPRSVVVASPPQTLKKGLGSLIITLISFVAGALVGLGVKSLRGRKDAPEKK